MDRDPAPDPEKLYGSGGSGSATLLPTVFEPVLLPHLIIHAKKVEQINFNHYLNGGEIFRTEKKMLSTNKDNIVN